MLFRSRVTRKVSPPSTTHEKQCYASNIVHAFVIYLSRPWATRRSHIGDKGLRASLGLSLPSKGLCIKDKSFDLVFILACWKSGIENKVSSLCVVTCFFISVSPSLVATLTIDSPFTTLMVLLLSFSSLFPLRSHSSTSRNRGRCL